MADERILEVQAQEDFVEKLAAARPAQALAELLWNGLDAEATKVSVEADRGPIGLTSIRVRDNGHGMAPEEAEGLFTSLGGSWKRGAKQSKNGKRLDIWYVLPIEAFAPCKSLRFYPQGGCKRPRFEHYREAWHLLRSDHQQYIHAKLRERFVKGS